MSEVELRRRLIDTYDKEGPYVHRYWNSAKHERRPDSLIHRWEEDYRALFPDDWERMRDNLGGEAHTNLEATVAKKYKVLKPMRLEAERRDGLDSDGDDPIFRIDFDHLVQIEPHLRPKQRESLRGRLHDFAWFAPPTVADRRHDKAGFALDREVRRRSAEMREILADLRRNERELLLPVLADYPGGRAFRLTFLAEPGFALAHPTIDFQKRFWTLYLRTGGSLLLALSHLDGDPSNDPEFYTGPGWQRRWGWRYEGGILRQLWPSDKQREFFLEIGWIEWWRREPISRFRTHVIEGVEPRLSLFGPHGEKISHTGGDDVDDRDQPR